MHNGFLSRPMSFKSKSVAMIIVGVIVSLAVIMTSIDVGTNILRVQQSWNEYTHISVKSDEYLHQIQRHFGYGGFIHNFKNLILRHDLSRIPPARQNLADTYQAITDYQTLALTEREAEALNDLKKTVDRYAENFDLATELIAEGVDAVSIDRIVKVDDTAAIVAMKTLADASHARMHNTRESTTASLNRSLTLIDYALIIVSFFIGAVSISLIYMYRLARSSENLGQQKQYSEDLLLSVPEAILVIDENGCIERWNKAAEKLFGYEGEAFKQLVVEDLMPIDLRQQHQKLRRQAFNKRQTRAMVDSDTLHILTKDRLKVPVEISIDFTTHNNKTKAIATIRDIRQQLQTQSSLKLSRMIFESTNQPIMITDNNRKIIDVNDAFCLLTGYQRSEIMQLGPDILQSGRHDDRFYQDLWTSLLERDHWKGEIWNKNKQGEIFPSLVTITIIRDSKGAISNFVAIYSDITAIKKQEAMLTQLANNDQLTKLPNRSLFQDRIQSALARARRHQGQFAVLYIDLDGFKHINDALGHAKGDEVLVETAQALLSSVREQDTAARLGGDEFAVIIDELTSQQDAIQITERIVLTLERRITDGTEIFPISASIGVAFYPTDGEDDATLMAHADEAMYAAKQKGKNRYCLYANRSATIRRLHNHEKHQ